MVDQGYINHIAFVLDDSGSMRHIREDLIQVADNQIKHLAAASKLHDQETRATVYAFDNGVECIYYDKDVLRLPSLKCKYKLGGTTALVSATLKAVDDLKQTATLYGDHSFLIFVLTDGEENASCIYDLRRFNRELNGLPDNWTISLLAPNQRSKDSAQRLGFPKDCIELWDATAAGVVEVARKLEKATTAYMEHRSSGKSVRGIKNIFILDTESVTEALRGGNLRVVDKSKYRELNVPKGRGLPSVKSQIENFVKNFHRLPYEKGCCYYQLTKSEIVQPSKRVAIRNKKTRELFAGDVARDMIGLPEFDNKRIKPLSSDEYDIFIQSTSNNRHIVENTDLIYFNF